MLESLAMEKHMKCNAKIVLIDCGKASAATRGFPIGIFRENSLPPSFHFPG